MGGRPGQVTTKVFAGFAPTKARMALALARLRGDAGRTDQARTFALFGLEHIGIAGYRRRDLELLAERIGSEQETGRLAASADGGRPFHGNRLA